MKSTKETITKRIGEVLQLLLDGAQVWDIVQYGSENGWRVGERQVRKYVARAHKLMAKAAERKRAKLLLWAIAKRNYLYARAVAVGDYRTALAVLRDLSLMQGLYPNPTENLRREIEGLRKQLDEAEKRPLAERPPGDARPDILPYPSAA